MADEEARVLTIHTTMEINIESDAILKFLADSRRYLDR